MRVYLGADHGGYSLKKALLPWLETLGYTAVDCGNTKLDSTDDFPDFAFAVADRVAADPGSRGIVLCRSAGGVTIAANKVKGIRCVQGVNPTDVIHNCDHNNINMLSIAGDYTSEGEAKELIKIFLTTPWFGAERFVRRLGKMKAREEAWLK
jgi:ribose 5-phosphate isomerase B